MCFGGCLQNLFPVIPEKKGGLLEVTLAKVGNSRSYYCKIYIPIRGRNPAIFFAKVISTPVGDYGFRLWMA